MISRRLSPSCVIIITKEGDKLIDEYVARRGEVSLELDELEVE